MNYVNEQNMQEILDGIARKIGQGGGSGLTKTILYEGTSQITATSGTSSYNLSNSLDNYDFVIVRIKGHYTGSPDGEYIVDVPLYKPYLAMSDENYYSFICKPQASTANFCGRFGLDMDNNAIYIGLREKASDIPYIYLASVTGYKLQSGGNSTEEQRIGTWMDGKPLYQKTIQVTLPSTAATTSIIHEFTDIKPDIMVELSGFAIDDNGTTRRNFYSINSRQEGSEYIECYFRNYYDPTTNAKIFSRVDSAWINKPAYITLQYTKTTD